MTVSSKAKEWAIALISGVPLAGLFILANRTPGWVSVVLYGVVIAALVAGFAYAIVLEGRAWQAIEGDADRRAEVAHKSIQGRMLANKPQGAASREETNRES